MKNRRGLKEKLNTFLFGKDLRITEGDAYTEERDYDYSSYLPLDKYIRREELPVGNAYRITDFGAKVNDIGTDNSAAINRCIDFCHENGGGFVIVSGGNYTSKTVYLKSNVTLFIEYGSSIIAEESGEGFGKAALIYADGCDNITITGGGEINGNGHLFGRRPLLSENITQPDEVIDVIKMRRDYRAQLRFPHPSKYGRLVELKKCRNIRIDNIILRDSAHWTLRMTKCENVAIENLVINNNRHVCNTDGIDLMQTSNVDIRHCFISCADDGIVLKNAIWEGCDGPMSRISVSDCEVISCTNAFKIGTETTYPISDVTVENCKFFMTDLYPGSVSGISIESVDGADVHGITLRNIEMDRCTCPIFIRLGNRNRAAKVNMQSASAVEFAKKAEGKGMDKTSFDMTGKIHGILIENITAKEIELPVIIAGCRQRGKTRRVCGVTLRNLDFSYRNATEIIDRRLFIPEYSREYPECWRFRNLPAYKLWARHAEGLIVENYRCRGLPDTWKKDIILKDVKNYTSD